MEDFIDLTSIERVLDFISGADKPHTSFYCSDVLQEYGSASTPILPTCKVDRDVDDQLEVTFEAMDSISTVGKPLQLPARSIKNIVHDFTYGCFSESTDKKLSIIEALGDHSDNYTPDEIIPMQEEVIVIEYTTHRVDFTQERSARRVFNAKVDSYREHLIARSAHKPIRLFIIITTPSTVWTNVPRVAQFWIDELCFRYRTALSIAYTIEADANIKVFSTEERDTKSKEVLAHLELTELVLSSGKISERALATIRDPKYDERIVHEHIKASLITGASNYLTENFLDGSIRLSNEEMASARASKMEDDFNALRDCQGETRDDLKACIQLPLVIIDNVEETGSTLVEDGNYYISTEDQASHPVLKMFAGAFFQGSNQEHFYADGDGNEVDLALLSDDLRKAKELELRPHRMSYHRIHMDNLNFSEQERLACLGINGKKWSRESSAVQDYRRYRKRPFALDVCTDDIDEMLRNESLFRSQEVSSIALSGREGLINMAYDLSQTKEETKEFMIKILTDYQESYLGRYLRMISLIATELDVSMKQHCKAGSWILKRVRGHSMYLLIRPTDSSKHLFFAMAWPTRSEIWAHNGTVFKAIHRTDDWSCTDIVSVNKSKLTNLVMAEARGLSIAALSMEHSRVPLMNGHSIFSTSEDPRIGRAKRYTMMSLVTMLHDKSCVDEALSEVRYIMLEGFKEKPQFPNPGKKFNKLSPVIRSRVHAWVYKRLRIAAERIVDAGGFGSGVDGGGVGWSGLFDACTGDPLEDFQQMTNTFYYNYLKNKDEVASPNSNIKLLEKILEHENKMPGTRALLGEESSSTCEYSFLEFSPDLVKYCCSVAQKNLEKKLGKEWKEQLDDEILQAIADVDLESLSTLKASSSFVNKWCQPAKGRPRAATAIKSLWEQTTGASKAIDLVNMCLQTLHKEEGLFIDLFKKNQHGGLREIYVLSAESRVIQAILEVISRTICRQFQSEIMTHPGFKLKAAGIHSSKTKTLLKTSRILTTCTSDDASKWNQGHYVTKFMIMLLTFTKPHLHNFILSALDLWLQKNIMIPQELLTMMEGTQLDNWLNSSLSSDVSKQLAQAYKSTSGVPWMQDGSRYITTESGMMQGILHYTSSLFHTVVQETMSNLANGFLSGKTFRSSITVLQSSDDSAMMISCPVETNEDTLRAYYLCTVVFHWKYELARMMGIYKSEKSTTGTINVMEFNSEYFDHGSLIRPTAKWVFACQQIPESETLYGRQEGFYNLASQVLEGGGSIMLTALCQLSQSLLYYLMMGCGISPGWFEFCFSVGDLPDPSLGFFLLDDPIICGLGTQRFLLYMALKNSELLSKKYKIALLTKTQLMAQDRGKLDQLDAIQGLLSTGAITESSLILYGDKKKWTKLVGSLNLPLDWKERLNENPEVLYRRAKNSEEYEQRLALKVHGPGVMASLSTGNMVTRAVASSVYILTRSVLSIKGPLAKKTTILRKLCMDKELAGELEPLSESEYASLFPHFPSYDSLIDTKSNVELKGHIDQTRKRRTKADIVIFDAPVNESYSLERVMMSIWFKTQFPTTSRYRDNLFAQYKKGIPWLSQDIQETLEQSPFEDQIQLRNFLSRQDMQDRVVHLNCAPVPGRKGKAILETVLYKNMWPNWVASTIIAQDRQQISLEYEKLTQELFMISKMPVDSRYKSELSREVLSNSHLPEMPSDTSLIRNPMVSLYLIQKVVQDVGIQTKGVRHKMGDKDVKKLLKWLILCSRLGTGVFGYFVKRQKFMSGRYQGRGIWVGKLDTSQVMIHIDSDARGTYLSRVYVTDSTRFMSNMPLLRSWCKDCNVEIRESNYRKKPGEQIAYRVNRTSYATYRSSFPPIIKNVELLVTDLNEIYLRYQSITLEQVGVSLRVVGEVANPLSNGNNREPDMIRITIMQCPVGILDSRLGMLDPEDLHLDRYRPFWSEWIARQRATPDMIASLLDNPRFFSSKLGFETEESAQRWMRALFWETTLIMGVSDRYSEPVLHDDDLLCEIDEDDLMGFAMDITGYHESLDDVLLDVRKEDNEPITNNLLTDLLESGDYEQLFGQADFQESMSVLSGNGPKDRIQRVLKPLLKDWIIQEGGSSLKTFLSTGQIGNMDQEQVQRLEWISGVVSQPTAIFQPDYAWGDLPDVDELDTESWADSVRNQEANISSGSNRSTEPI